MTKIFINYLTGDEENVAAILDTYLSDRFDSDVFFRASRSIRFGDDFRRALLRAVRKSDVLLAVIGADWLTIAENGRRKIDQENNWTRREIVEALRIGIHVVPVLVGSAPRLTEKDLPPALAALAVCQYAPLRNRDARKDLDELAGQLMRLVPGLTERTRPGGGAHIRVHGRAEAGVIAERDIVIARDPNKIARGPGGSAGGLEARELKADYIALRDYLEESGE